MISRFCLGTMKTIVVAAALIIAVSLPESFAIAAEASQQDDQKVSIELYYESQCPGCREMITTSFNEAFQKEGFLDMATVTFVPYGNAKEKEIDKGVYEFECQHGFSECVYNVVEACALSKIKSPLSAFQYIDCIERSDESRDPDQDYFKVFLHCALLTELDEETIDDIFQCSTGAEGMELEHEAAVETDSLYPPHQFVPYVVVNGEHSDEIQDSISESLFDYVCANYLGPDKSKECSTPGVRAGASASVRVPADEKTACVREKESFARAGGASMAIEK